MPRTSVIIPTYDNWSLLRVCLESPGLSATTDDLEIIVVDNGSTNQTTDYLAKYHPDVKVVRNSTNLGFARGCNAGAAAASGDVLIFLNDDTVPAVGCFTPLIDCVQGNALDIAGSVLFYPNGHVQHSGVTFNDEGIPHNYQGQAPASHWREPLLMQAVTGASLALKRDLFVTLQGFDTRFVNSYEDVDLCLRAIRLRRRVGICANSRFVHLESQTKGRHDHHQANKRNFRQLWSNTVVPDSLRVDALNRGCDTRNLVLGGAPSVGANWAKGTVSPESNLRTVLNEWTGGILVAASPHHAASAHLEEERVLASRSLNDWRERSIVQLDRFDLQAVGLAEGLETTENLRRYLLTAHTDSPSLVVY